MTRPRPELIIATWEDDEQPSYLSICGWTAEYNGVLEKPRIIISEECPENINLIGHIISHEIIHWVLHKRLGEDVCHLLDHIAYKIDNRRSKRAY